MNCIICSTEIVQTGRGPKKKYCSPSCAKEGHRQNALMREVNKRQKKFFVATSEKVSARADMLREAENLVDGDRRELYGDPRQDFRRTAAMWEAYLGVEINPHDVAAMMAMLKISRIRWSPQNRDSWVDLAGWAACGWDSARPLGEVVHADKG